jgi:electron transfer flavoprotein alpha subunit
MTGRKKQAIPSIVFSADEETNMILVYLECRDGSIASVSLELLGKARGLADQSESRLIGLIIGHELEALAKEAISNGADEVVLLEDQLLSSFNVEAYTEVAAQVIIEEKPSVLLIGATHDGRDLAGRLAVRLQTGLNADCTDLLLDPESGLLISEVTGFGGGIIALLDCPDRRPQMSTVRPGVFPLPVADEKRTGEVVRREIQLRDDCIQTFVIEQDRHDGVDLTQAEILICGGRGMGGDFNSLKSLADLLPGEVGATRPPVDDGYIERERQIGQTGVVCSPKVAICLGISGAFHFVVGIEKADLVIAVNSDPSAPIFDYADYGIVADVTEVLPALMHAFEAHLEKTHV